MSNQKKTAIVIGAGIVGIAMARSLASRGVIVTVIERNEQAIGASIRNFGMLWPIGQPDGYLYERAINSRSIWQQVLNDAHLWYDEVGSLHAAYNGLESQVLKDVSVTYEHRGYKYLNTTETIKRSNAVNPDGLEGALWSPNEMIIESRAAIQALPAYFTEKYGVKFLFNTAISRIEYPKVFSGNRSWSADYIYVCGGADFETLYPEVFAENNFTKCKLQMMRIIAQPDAWRIGPALCGGLSLIHYNSFKVSPSLDLLKKHFEQTMPEYLKYGIHVMVSQNGNGELTIGDTHEYGLHLDPFDRAELNDMIITYLKKFAIFKNWAITQSWNGTYPKRTNGEVDFVHQPVDGVTIVNGLGGAGMTLSFGLAEEIVSKSH
ncbi:MAG: TIGR03364 family FAD-dependent oxidoreductase [Bacteroidota bacterium]